MLIGIVSAWLVLGELPTVPELVGGAIMLTGLAIAVITWGPRPSVPAVPAELRDKVLE